MKYKKLIAVITVVIMCMVCFAAIAGAFTKEQEPQIIKHNKHGAFDFDDKIEHENTYVPDSIIKAGGYNNIHNENMIPDMYMTGISCWGDSMMEGVGSEDAYILTDQGDVDISYYTTPYTLEKLTGINTYNFGVSGETSDEIARRAGGLKMYTDRDLYLTKDMVEDVCFVDDQGNPVYMYDFSGYGIEDNDYPDTVYINGILCQIEKKWEIDDDDWSDNRDTGFDIDDYIVGIKIYDNEFVNNQPDYMYVESGTTAVPKAANDHKDDILILEMGSNGGWDDYEDLISQYQSIIDYTGCSNYIIVGDTDDPGKSLADDEDYDYNADDQNIEYTEWESALQEAFGEHFINTREYLIKNGLRDCGLRENTLDKIYRAFGCISVKLRSDWTHFNAYGYYSKGIAIYQKGRELGYWE